MTAPGWLKAILMIVAGWMFAVEIFAFPPPGCWIRDGLSLESGAVWLLCEQGVLLHSADSGESWTQVQLPAQGNLRALALARERDLIIVGENGQIWLGEDYGQRWQRVPSGVNRNLNDVVFVGAEGWAVGAYGTILHSPDGGRSWESQRSFTTSSLEGVFFLDSQHGWAVGWAGTILRTNNGGKFWQAVTVAGLASTLTAVEFKNPMEGWIVGAPSLVLKTTDGGQSWTRVGVPLAGWLSAVHLVGDRVYIAGEHLIVSEDGGQSWRQLQTPAEEPLISVWVQAGRLWVLGSHTILASADGGRSWKRWPAAPEPQLGRVGKGWSCWPEREPRLIRWSSEGHRPAEKQVVSYQYLTARS